jgi:hypothetical protein
MSFFALAGARLARSNMVFPNIREGVEAGIVYVNLHYFSMS